MDDKPVSIWLIGNTGLRNPRRIAEGFELYAHSSFVGRLHGRENEYAFMRFLHDNGIINNEPGRDDSASHARKWRLMFSRNGFVYPKITKKEGNQADLGLPDQITPFGFQFLQASTYSAQQECYLRALSVEQILTTGKTGYFSPLRWVLAIMLELEHQTGSSEISRTEFSLWGHATDPTYDINYVVNEILDLRSRRKAAPSKIVFDRNEVKARGENYFKKNDNFFDYADMNMRYLRITGIIQRKGRGLILVPTKHILAERLAKTTVSETTLLEALKILANGATLPSDDIATAKMLLASVEATAKKRGVFYDISDIAIDNPLNANIARLRIEEQLQRTNELDYAARQHGEWREIAEYMKLIERGGGSSDEDDDDLRVEVPKDELPAYLEWVLWRAELAVDHMITHPYDVRGFKIDADFLPVNTASGGRGDLYCEFEDFVLVTEVSMSSSSRQEAMEGEPVRRHVSNVIDGSAVPVFGLFVAIKIDTNTAETFRHGTWYDRNDNKRRLDIVPLTLAQFREHFVAMFESDNVSPQVLRELIVACTLRRDVLTGPIWKQYIGRAVAMRIKCLIAGETWRDGGLLLIQPGSAIVHPVLGTGHVLLAVVAYDKPCDALVDLPFATVLPENVRLTIDGAGVEHDEKGHGDIVGYKVAFGDKLFYMSKDMMLEEAEICE